MHCRARNALQGDLNTAAISKFTEVERWYFYSKTKRMEQYDCNESQTRQDKLFLNFNLLIYNLNRKEI